MSPFFSPNKRAAGLKPKIKEIVWDVWEQYWPEEALRERYIAALLRASANLFSFIWRSWPEAEPMIDRVETAILFATRAHAAQKPRKTGEPYVMHPIKVAISCAERGLDTEGILSALCHDILEDTETTREELQALFGEDVAQIVDGLSKVKSKDKAMFDRDKVLTFLKILGADKRDNQLRTILIKILDRSDNMDTIDVFRKEKQQRYGQETISIYASLANILGIRTISRLLISKSIKPLFPEQFANVNRKLNKRMQSYNSGVRDLQEKIRNVVNGRVDIKFLQIPPILGDFLDRERATIKPTAPPLTLRIRVPNISQMYTVLGLIHTLGLSTNGPVAQQSDTEVSIVSDSWRDFVVSPLANGYRALTTTVVFRGETWLLEILSAEMEGIVDWGILSNFKSQELRDFYHTSITAFLNNIANIEHMRYQDLQNLTSSAVADIQVRLSSGSFMRLPRGSTVVDLAYLVDSDVGLYCSGAVVNGKHRPAEYPLHHGEAVDLKTSPTPIIKRSYFTIMKSRRALENYRETIHSYYNKKGYELGKRLISDFLAHFKMDLSVVDEEGEGGIGSPDEVIDVGLGKLSVAQLLESLGIEVPTEGFFSKRAAVLPRRIDVPDDLMYSYPSCCNIFPLVDEEVVMQYTPTDHEGSNLGLLHLHNQSCPNLDLARTIIPVEWGIRFPAEVPLKLYIEDSVGLAGKITGAVSKNHLNILSLSADSRGEREQHFLSLVIQLRQDENWRIDEKRFITCIKMLRKIKEIRRIEISRE